MSAQPNDSEFLKVGIMVNSLVCPRWVVKIVQDIQSSTFARVVLVIKNQAQQSAPQKSFRQRLRGYWTHSLFERYRRWDRSKYRSDPDAFENVDMCSVLQDVPAIAATPIQKGFVDRFTAEDLGKIAAANLDVLFRFGFRIIRGEILRSAKYGVWSFHHGDNREYRGAPPGFWEIYERNPVTGSILQILSDKLDNGRVIYRSRSATNFDSLYCSLNPLYWKSAAFALRRLRDLHRYGWKFLTSLPEYNEPDAYNKSIYRTPTTPVMIRFLTRLMLRKFFQALRGRLFERRTQWFIAKRPRNDSTTVLDHCNGFSPIIAPRGRFYADPFILRLNDKSYLFFEDFDFKKNRASIACAEINGLGFRGAPFTVLAPDCHLSYPFVFKHGSEIFMVPETKEQRTIELYRAVEFPYKWERFRSIASNVQAVDSTLLAHVGKLWLFTNIAQPGASTFDELHLFFANSVDGEWTPHPRNPIVSDVTRARPAGALFFDGNRLIRPSQDCSVRYGSAISMNHVTLLSESDYQETPIARVNPGWHRGSICTHTYNRSEDFEVLDGMIPKWKFRLLRSEQSVKID